MGWGRDGVRRLLRFMFSTQMCRHKLHGHVILRGVWFPLTCALAMKSSQAALLSLATLATLWGGGVVRGGEGQWSVTCASRLLTAPDKKKKSSEPSTRSALICDTLVKTVKRPSLMFAEDGKVYTGIGADNYLFVSLTCYHPVILWSSLSSAEMGVREAHVFVIVAEKPMRG